MEGRGKITVAAAMVMIFVVGVMGEEEGNHHVAGGDHGWDVSSDMAEWSSDRLFRVGDDLWFAYYASEQGMAEIGSKEEFELCDLTHPIKMYTDGLTRVKLDTEGSRYFVGTMRGSCNNGLKLQVNVLPKSYVVSPRSSEEKAIDKPIKLAEEPSPPSGAAGAIVMKGSLAAFTMLSFMVFYGFV